MKHLRWMPFGHPHAGDTPKRRWLLHRRPTEASHGRHQRHNGQSQRQRVGARLILVFVVFAHPVHQDAVAIALEFWPVAVDTQLLRDVVLPQRERSLNEQQALGAHHEAHDEQQAKTGPKRGHVPR